MNLSKVLLEGRMINRKISELTTTPIKLVALPKLKRKLLSTLEIKDKYDLKGANDPDENKINMKSRKMFLALKVKVKFRNDERMRCPHPPRRLRWNKLKNKEKERTFLSSMLSQKYLPPSSDLIELMID